MDGANIIGELLITGMLDQDSNKPKKGCSIFIVLALLAILVWVGYIFMTDK